MIGSSSSENQPLGDETSGTGSPATTLQVGVDPAGVNGLVAPQEGFHQPNFHVDNLESYRMDDRFVAERDAWCFAFIGKWFSFKDMELEDDLDFKDRHPSNRFRIIGIVHYDGERKVFIPATVRYARKRLFFLCCSADKPRDYELVSTESFHPRLHESYRFYQIIS